MSVNLRGLDSLKNLLPPLHLNNFSLTLARVALKSELGSGGVQEAKSVNTQREGTVLQVQMRIQEAEPVVRSSWLSGNITQ